MSKRALLMLLGCFGLFVQMSAQGRLFESMKESFDSRPKLMLKLGTRNSFITNSFVKVRDIQLGLNFNNTTKIGVGYNWLASDVVRPLSIDGTEVHYNEGTLKMRYIAPFIEYTFLKNKRYSMSIPVQVGIGSGFYEFKTDEGAQVVTDPVTVAFYEPAMTAEYVVLRYFGVGAGFGYRLMFAGNKGFDEKFTAPVYMFKFKVYFGKVYKDVKNLVSPD